MRPLSCGVLFCLTLASTVILLRWTRCPHTILTSLRPKRKNHPPRAKCDGLGGCHNDFVPTDVYYPPKVDLGFTYAPSPPIELVLARYAEDLTWIADMPFPVTVYDHMDEDSPHYVPNQAAESSCYVKYIIDRYDTLPNVSVFMQAGGQHHNWQVFGAVFAGEPGVSFRTPHDGAQYATHPLGDTQADWPRPSYLCTNLKGAASEPLALSAQEVPCHATHQGSTGK